MAHLTWADARPMLHQLKQLSRFQSKGAQLLFDGGFVGSIEGDMLVLRGPSGPADSHEEEGGDVIFTQPKTWPLSEARGRD